MGRTDAFQPAIEQQHDPERDTGDTGCGRQITAGTLPALPLPVAVSFYTGDCGILVEKALFKSFMLITGPVTAVSPHDRVLYNHELAIPAFFYRSMMAGPAPDP